MGLPWNNWYHCMGNTYGTWLPGDPRGFRSRQHREHVEGDYKSPPPDGLYDQHHQSSRVVMTNDEVVFDSLEVRQLACQLLGESLTFYHIELIALCVAKTHFHLLARFPLPPPDSKLWQFASKSPPSPEGGLPRWRNPLPRWAVGKAKSWTPRQLKSAGDFDHHDGGMFAEKGKVVPIEDQSYQLAVVRYIRKHGGEGGAVWSGLDRSL